MSFINDLKTYGRRYRSSGRVNVKMKAQYRHLYNDKRGPGQWLTCDITDISAGGVNIIGSFSFIVGDRIELEFFLNKKYVAVTVEVTNIRGKRGGAKFIDLSEEYTTLIHYFISASLIKQ